MQDWIGLGADFDGRMCMVGIDRATSTDLEGVIDLLRQQFAEHHITCDADQLRQAVTPMLGPRGPGFVLLARACGRCVGIAAVSLVWTLEHGGRSAWLDELYVVPDHRGTGTGTRLLDGALAVATAAGCRAIDLEVDVDHRRAEGLYRRKGFRPLNRTRWVRLLQEASVDG